MQRKPLRQALLALCLFTMVIALPASKGNPIEYPTGSSRLGTDEVPIVFSEIMYHPGRDNKGGEYIELTNRSQQPFDLLGWSLGGGVTYTFTESQIIPPAGSIVLAEDAQDARGFYGDTTIVGSYQGSLANEGEVISLCNPKGFAVLTVAYHTQWPWPSAADGLGTSLELINLDADPTLAQAWETGTPYSPGATNQSAPTVETGTVVINEIMYHPAGENGDLEYIELHNPSSNAIDLSGWSLVSAIRYAFPNGTRLNRGTYLIVTRSQPTFVDHYPNVTATVLGDYQGKLSNAGETVGLLNNHGDIVDIVAYGDGGRWPELADGQGPSLELIHPGVYNNSPGVWADSTDAGTPGQRNSVWQTHPSPFVEILRHDPAIPLPTEPVIVTAAVFDSLAPQTVTLHYRVSGNAWSQTAMQASTTPDHWTGQVPPRAQGTIVEFYVKATDAQHQSHIAPLGAPQENALYQVDGSTHATPRETYRVVMAPRDYDVGNDSLLERNIRSNELLNCTFIAGNEIRYNAGIRLRGWSSRSFPPPKNFRVQFTRTDLPFRGLERLNLNGVDNDPRGSHPRYEYAIASHALGHDFLQRAGVVDLRPQLISLVINNEFWPNYIYLAPMDDVFARLSFPGDDGNLYNCVRPYGASKPHADLDYRGTDPDAYRPDYFKRTNETEDDWSDLIDLTCTLDTTCTPDDVFIQQVWNRIDVVQWMRFFAAINLIGYEEGGIHTNSGTEYNMYRRESDGRFVMIPWDLDALFHNHAQRTIFTQKLPPVEHFIKHPDLKPLYYQAFSELLAGPFSEAEMRKSTERYRGLLQNEFLDQINDFVKERRVSVLSQLSNNQ